MWELSEFAKTVIYSAGVSSSLVLAGVWLSRTWLERRLSYEYQKQITELSESLKRQSDITTSQLNAELGRVNERLKHSAQVSAEVQKVMIQKRVSAVEEIWRATLQVEETIPAIFLLLDIGFDSEYESIARRADFSSELSKLDHRVVIKAAIDQSPQLAQSRPFTGNYLWVIFSTYRAVVFRMIYLVDESKAQPNKLYWYRDTLLREQLQAALGKEALEEFDGLQVRRIDWLKKRFSKAILDAIEHVIEGHDAGESAMQQAARMESLLTRAKESNEKRPQQRPLCF